MIVRAILHQSQAQINNFDFFNDYTDTMRWLLSLPQSLEQARAIVLLGDAHKQYVERKQAEELAEGAYDQYNQVLDEPCYHGSPWKQLPKLTRDAWIAAVKYSIDRFQQSTRIGH